MASKLLGATLLVAVSLALAEDSHDEVTLLQTQVEVKKNEARPSLYDDVDDGAEPGYASPCSSGTCGKAELPAAFKLDLPAGDAAAVEPEEKSAETSGTKEEASDELPKSGVSLGTALQALAILLIGDVLRRKPWEAKASTKAAATTSSKVSHSEPAAAILTAALTGDKSVFEANIDSSLSQLSKVDTWGCSILHYAAKGGSAAIVQKLVDLGATVEALDAWDETPLHLAARAGHAEVCEILLLAGALVDAANAEECTPLIVAGRADQEATCRLLLEHGAVTGEGVPEVVARLLAEQEGLQA